jgi:chromosome segregation ATPase
MRGAAIVGAFVGAASAATMSATQQAATQAFATPLTKVVTLLKEMRATVEKELKEDQAIYDKLACWCHTNEEEKSDAVEVAQQRIESLKAKISEYTGKKAGLAEEIKKTKEDLASNEESLAQAVAQRQKEGDEFHKLETDNVQAIAQLKGAITILSRHNESLLQASALSSMTTIVKHLQYKFQDAVSEDDVKQALSLLEARPYASQSGEIFGFMTSMLENMEKSYAQAQAEEAKAVADFNALKEAKTDEIAAGRELLESKEEEFADVSEKLAQAKEDLEDTTEALESDQAFLLDLEKRCKANDSEMEARNKVRLQEVAAINDTIGILTSDDARDTANAAFNFLQQRLSSEQNSLLRKAAAKRLTALAVKHNNPEMAMLATSVQLDAFTKVKKAIDDMVAALKQQQADEVKHKDFCNTEFHTTETTTTKTDRKLEGLKGKSDDLEASIKDFSDTIATLTAEIADARLELQRATNDQVAASKEFKQVVADQQATQAILQKATARLSKFYGFVQTTSHQEPGAAVEGPPPALKEGGYKKSSASGGVMGMLAEIMNDSKEAEMEAIKDHQNAVTAYEEFVANTNNMVENKQKAVVTNTENKAAADKELVATKESIKATMTELEKLAEYTAQLHKACDFTLKNFDTRQTARSEEIEALGQAKSILSGAA